MIGTEVETGLQVNTYNTVIYGRIEAIDLGIGNLLDFKGRMREHFTCNTTEFTFGLKDRNFLVNVLDQDIVLVLDDKNTVSLVYKVHVELPPHE